MSAIHDLGYKYFKLVGSELAKCVGTLGHMIVQEVSPKKIARSATSFHQAFQRYSGNFEVNRRVDARLFAAQVSEAAIHVRVWLKALPELEKELWSLDVAGQSLENLISELDLKGEGGEAKSKEIRKAVQARCLAAAKYATFRAARAEPPVSFNDMRNEQVRAMKEALKPFSTMITLVKNMDGLSDEAKQQAVRDILQFGIAGASQINKGEAGGGKAADDGIPLAKGFALYAFSNGLLKEVSKAADEVVPGENSIPVRIAAAIPGPLGANRSWSSLIEVFTDPEIKKIRGISARIQQDEKALKAVAKTVEKYGGTLERSGRITVPNDKANETIFRKLDPASPILTFEAIAARLNVLHLQTITRTELLAATLAKEFDGKNDDPEGKKNFVKGNGEEFASLGNKMMLYADFMGEVLTDPELHAALPASERATVARVGEKLQKAAKNDILWRAMAAWGDFAAAAPEKAIKLVDFVRSETGAA